MIREFGDDEAENRLYIYIYIYIYISQSGDDKAQ